MTAPVCRACGSDDVLADAVVDDYDARSKRPLSVTVARARPEVVGEVLGISALRTAVSRPLHARVCLTCGAVDLYVADTAALREAASG